MKTIAISGLLALGLAAAIFAPESNASAKERVALHLGTDVALACSNPGSSQDVAKTPIIKNTTGVTIPSGKVVTWSTNSGDKGTFTLTAPLAPGATVRAQGGPGNGYQCTAHISSMPDLIPSKMQWQGNTSIKVDVTNLDPWVSADASIVRVEVMSCSGQVLQSYDSPPTAIAKGEVKSMTFPATFVPGKAYVRITADATLKVLERNESNNVIDGIGSCVH